MIRGDWVPGRYRRSLAIPVRWQEGPVYCTML